ncbi:MAG: HD domain-containing phosphohydrolase [Vicinamibacterales bacterium]
MFAKLRPSAKAYVASVAVAGIATVLHSVSSLYSEPIGPQWLILAALTVLTGSFTIKVPSITARISVSETFVFASVLLFGAAAGTLTVLLETLIVSLWLKPQARSLPRLLFNIGSSAVSIWFSATVFYQWPGMQPYSRQATPLVSLFVPLSIMTVLYFLSNSWLVAIALAFERRQSASEIWWKNFTWLSVNYFSGASLAALIVTYTRDLEFSTLAVIVPLLVISYLTFKTAMARVEDSNRHLGELNELYLSTIETLAMAIDAKDQITHGHIRRVQTYAVGLAQKLGVADDKLIRAIEAASLLHDTGKLAVPEYILNKPGKLSAAEFEKMKLHASVGADILSAVPFPFPVVPIVRHHHENWDGTGYPTGLKGTDIPIGARILSVVDCFDALTSDRPYRPKLSDDDALRILTERRGNMYDPLVVDTFVQVHREIAPEGPPGGPPQDVLEEIASTLKNVLPHPAVQHADAVGIGLPFTANEPARIRVGEGSVTLVRDAIGEYLKQLIPFSVCVLYVNDITTAELEAAHVVGDAWASVKGLRIPIGQKLSGWVAANRQAISNSDPTLDLGVLAQGLPSQLRSCLSVPLLFKDELIGVLTLYSTTLNGFDDSHQKVAESVAHDLARMLKLAEELDTLETGGRSQSSSKFVRARHQSAATRTA